jgi:glycosyltransferase involved in cell wall biosynthesis
VLNDWKVISAIRSIKNAKKSEQINISIQYGGEKSELLLAIQSELRSHDRIFIRPDSGIFDALNKLLDEAAGDWVGWLGSDDMLARTFDPDVLFNQPNKVSGVSFTTIMFDGMSNRAKRIYRPVRPKLLRRVGYHLPHFSTFLRRDWARSTRFDAKKANYADIFYFLEIEKKVEIVVLPRVCSTLMEAGGASNASMIVILKTNARLFNDLKNELGLMLSIIFIFNKILYKSVQSVVTKLPIRREQIFPSK